MLVLALAALYRRLHDRRQWAEAAASIREATTLLAERMADGDKRDERIAELTEQMESYGRTSVKLAAASLAVAVAALAVAVVVTVAM